MRAAHTRGSADSGSVQRTQIAFPLENALAVLKALEAARHLSSAPLIMPETGESRRGVYGHSLV